MTRHRLDVLSLTAGAVFVGLAITFLAAGDAVVNAAHWVWPVLLVSLGVAGLISALRRDDEPESEPEV
jgi:putative Mn2+ efflux pump MntP